MRLCVSVTSCSITIIFQGYKQQKAYIIAEGPMESTARNMWKVVYDRKCASIIMLSDLIENGKVRPSSQNILSHCCVSIVKHTFTASIHLLAFIIQESCFQYWPAVGKTAKFGEYTVDLTSEEILGGFAIRTLNVLHKKVLHWNLR